MGGWVHKNFLQKKKKKKMYLVLNLRVPGLGFGVPPGFCPSILESWEAHPCSPALLAGGGSRELENQLCMFLQNLGEKRDLPGEVGFPRQEMHVRE